VQCVLNRERVRERERVRVRVREREREHTQRESVSYLAMACQKGRERQLRPWGKGICVCMWMGLQFQELTLHDDGVRQGTWKFRNEMCPSFSLEEVTEYWYCVGSSCLRRRNSARDKKL
jgi:hypothetical protein